MITDIELTVYNEHGESINIPLSHTQAKTVFKILMITPNDESSLNMASDKTLETFWRMKGNPLRLKECSNDD